MNTKKKYARNSSLYKRFKVIDEEFNNKNLEINAMQSVDNGKSRKLSVLFNKFRSISTESIPNLSDNDSNNDNSGLFNDDNIADVLDFDDDKPTENDFDFDENNTEDSDSDCNDSNTEDSDSDCDDFDFDLDSNYFEESNLNKNKLSDLESRFFKMSIESKLSEAQSENIIRFMQREFNAKIRCHKTLSNHFSSQSIRHFYYQPCKNCDDICIKLTNSSKYKCRKCLNLCDKHTPIEFVAFNLADQIMKISEIVKINANVDQILTLDFIVTSDGIPLSKSSHIDLYPIIIYLRNIENSNLRWKSFIVASMAMAKKTEFKKNFAESNNISDTLLKPFYYEYLQIKKYPLKTSWSNFTNISIYAFIADCPCRAIFLKVKQHNGRHPCHRYRN